MKENSKKMIRVKPSAVAKRASSSVDKSFRSSMFYNFFRTHRSSEQRFNSGFFGKSKSRKIYITSITFRACSSCRTCALDASWPKLTRTVPLSRVPALSWAKGAQ